MWNFETRSESNNETHMRARLRTAALTVFIIAAAFFGLVLVSGVLYEQMQRARDRDRFPQIGRSVDIGGRILNLYCSGVGQPAVILERGAPWVFYNNPKAMFDNGSPRPGYGWVSIERELAKITTACWYDRAGTGWSDAGPYPRDSASQARDLHTLLEAAGVRPPYVLAAESSAALDAHVYAGYFPGDVAGLVFIDGVHPDLLTETRPSSGNMARMPEFVFHSQDAVAQIMNGIGLYRLGLPKKPPPSPPKGISSTEWNTIWSLSQSSKARSALVQEIASWQQSATEAKNAGNLGDCPLIVLSGRQAPVSAEYSSVWTELQNELAGLSARGRRMIVEESNGELIYEAPDAVIEATHQVISDVRRRAVRLR
jgi:pimeloyl-ACP methyl ester carboxylesterase